MVERYDRVGEAYYTAPVKDRFTVNFFSLIGMRSSPLSCFASPVGHQPFTVLPRGIPPCLRPSLMFFPFPVDQHSHPCLPHMKCQVYGTLLLRPMARFSLLESPSFFPVAPGSVTSFCGPFVHCRKIRPLHLSPPPYLWEGMRPLPKRPRLSRAPTSPMR